jgi:CheY-like chemotaxis protein
MLRYEGFEVIEAASGKEALATLAANPDIRLAIIDVVMPEMPGTVLASLLPQVAPACGIILMTGYTRDQARLGSSFSAHPVLVKPFTTNQLIKQVVTLLEGGSH